MPPTSETAEISSSLSSARKEDYISESCLLQMVFSSWPTAFLAAMNSPVTCFSFCLARVDGQMEGLSKLKF